MDDSRYFLQVDASYWWWPDLMLFSVSLLGILSSNPLKEKHQMMTELQRGAVADRRAGIKGSCNAPKLDVHGNFSKLQESMHIPCHQSFCNP